jgi:hypothetical protein
MFIPDRLRVEFSIKRHGSKPEETFSSCMPTEKTLECHLKVIYGKNGKGSDKK